MPKPLAQAEAQASLDAPAQAVPSAPPTATATGLPLANPPTAKASAWARMPTFPELVTDSSAKPPYPAVCEIPAAKADPLAHASFTAVAVVQANGVSPPTATATGSPVAVPPIAEAKALALISPLLLTVRFAAPASHAN